MEKCILVEHEREEESGLEGSSSRCPPVSCLYCTSKACQERVNTQDNSHLTSSASVPARVNCVVMTGVPSVIKCPFSGLTFLSLNSRITPIGRQLLVQASPNHNHDDQIHHARPRRRALWYSFSPAQAAILTTCRCPHCGRGLPVTLRLSLPPPLRPRSLLQHHQAGQVQSMREPSPVAHLHLTRCRGKQTVVPVGSRSTGPIGGSSQAALEDHLNARVAPYLKKALIEGLNTE